MNEYIKFWLAKEVAEWIVIITLRIIIGIALLIYYWWENNNES